MAMMMKRMTVIMWGFQNEEREDDEFLLSPLPLARKLFLHI